MPLLLSIDTATGNASVCLSRGKQILFLEKSGEQKNHASFIQPAIKKIMQNAAIDLQQVYAIAVTAGPGSYTGLRVGLASAKGLCFALNKPLICVNTLEVMAAASIEAVGAEAANMLHCPMIDARRMEVFAAVYNKNIIAVKAPCSMILDEKSFAEELSTHTVAFTGSGIAKAEKILQHPNACFMHILHSAEHLAQLALQHFNEKNFTGAAYAQPLYLKEFYSTTPVKNIVMK